MFLNVLSKITTGSRTPSKLLQLRHYSDQIDFNKLVKNSKVVVFMKGIPDQPRCGFSSAVVQILRMHGVSYDFHDVLKNEYIREGIKKFSNWPTIPQVFINGDFVGGCDILIQMHQNGELIEELKKVGIKSALLEKTENNLTDNQKTASEKK